MHSHASEYYYYAQGYFDTLRMEVADKGIEILSVCPGPVDTPFLRDIFREKVNSETRVSVSVLREIHLMCTCIPPSTLGRQAPFLIAYN